MNDIALRLLLATNGSETTRPALDYGVWLADLLKARVLLLGIVEGKDEKGNVEKLIDATAQQLEALKIPYQSQIDTGRGSVVIARHTKGEDLLTVVGPLGRPIWRRLVTGRSFRRLLSKIETPILYVPALRLPLRHVLVCMGGLGYASGVEHLSLYLAKKAGAKITLLHVVGPITLDYRLAHQVEEHWDKILETDTPQGRSLREAIEDIQNAGIAVDFKVRQGTIVHEILEEVRDESYDLIGMGSPYSAHSLRQLYMPNVTAEVAESLKRPVLAVRYGHDLVSPPAHQDE